jgi:hypothetical protein
MRRGLREINRRQALVVIWYNHARTEPRPSKLAKPRQAPSNDS